MPTLDESGFPGFNVTAWHGVVAPAKVAPDIIAKLPEVQEVLLQEGGDITLSAPEAFAVVIRDEYAMYQKVVKQADVTLDT